MFPVTYTHQHGYLYVGRDRHFPGLVIQVQNPDAPDRLVEVQGHLDSGAEYSLFNGWIAQSVGLDLYSGPERRYAPTRGDSVDARVHRVMLVHPELGTFDLNIGFSTDQIRRNLLGRDFFNLIQIGFRERHMVFYVTPTP